MNRSEFRKLASSGVICLDGATGTELSKRGMPAGVCPEAWVLEHPESILSVQREYISAGSRIIYTPTFGGNRLKLKEFGLSGRCREINQGLAHLSREAADGHALVFGDIAPTGHFIAPLGPMDFEEAVDVFREQISALVDAGVDGLAIETMMDLQEARAALIAARELTQELPVLVTMTFDPNGRSLASNTPLSSLIALQALGADAFGCNCSTGPETMLSVISTLKPYAKIPLVAKPNAGLPRLVDNRTVFSMDASAFASYGPRMAEAGATFIGGCCGTTPDFIKALSQATQSFPAPAIGAQFAGVISSAQAIHRISLDSPFTLIGERLNPTGKKRLQEELRACHMEYVCQMAQEQCSAGADALDINVGMSGVNEKELMTRIIQEISTSCDKPLCIDTTNPDVAELALRRYPGRALFNSITGEKSRMEKILPILAKYGAMPVILPLTDAGIPATAEARYETAMSIAQSLSSYGIKQNECCVDALVMTISADPAAAIVTLQTIRKLHEAGWNTICGLSNVSFGLPERNLVNRAFLAMAISQGLNCAIANPCIPDIPATIASCDALRNADESCARYIAFATKNKTSAENSHSVPEEKNTPQANLAGAVLKGNSEGIHRHIDKALEAGLQASELVTDILIPAIMEVGSKFEQKIYFLPQLIRSADAMRTAMDILLPQLEKKKGALAKQGKILLATVKGDIHDIGKNIVAMMLRNYNFDVIDLGKDVPAETILDTAVERHCDLIGLSALMTTTMGEMGRTIELAKERGLTQLKFIVGGAVVDQHYADEIGALYAKDALETVKLAQGLVK